LVAARECTLPGSTELARLETELRAVNEARWQSENEIRLCERDEDFGPRFIALARSVCRTNDRRAALKRQINELLGSELIEENSYASKRPARSGPGAREPGTGRLKPMTPSLPRAYPHSTDLRHHRVLRPSNKTVPGIGRRRGEAAGGPLRPAGRGAARRARLAELGRLGHE
jgi:hypothetical protein